MQTKSESGFSYIDVMIAIVILMIGILAMLSALSYSVIQSKGQEAQLYAKQLAGSTLESVMSVKETNDENRRLGWRALRNKCTPAAANCDPDGKFPIGFQAVKSEAGPDQIIGSDEDTGSDIPGYSRRIEITDVCDTERPSPAPVCAATLKGTNRVRMRLVTVTVNYFVNSLQRQETVSTVLTDYAIEQGGNP